MPDSPELPDERRLLGRWRLIQADSALEFAPQARMHFLTGGRLQYDFDVGAHRRQVNMLYRVEGNTLHTEVLETSHQQSAPFSFGPGEVLVFDFAGLRAIFIREI
jgi:hypothetical protein